jgi:hypothetical protein
VSAVERGRECDVCEGAGLVAAAFGVHSAGKPRIAPCPVCGVCDDCGVPLELHPEPGGRGCYLAETAATVDHFPTRADADEARGLDQRLREQDGR